MITKQMQVANKAHSWAHGKASPCSHPTCKFVRKATGHIDMRLTYPKLRLAAFNCLFLCKFARSKMSTQLKFNPQSAALRLINNFQYLCESTPLVFLKKNAASGGQVLRASQSLHYWQPNPRWRPVTPMGGKSWKNTACIQPPPKEGKEAGPCQWKEATYTHQMPNTW